MKTENKTVKDTAANVKTTAKSAATAAKSAAKNAAEKTVKAAEKVVKETRKSTVKETIYLQYLGKEINKDDIMKSVEEIWTKQMKKKVSDMKSVALYLKPEENAAYFVVNGEVTGKVEL